MNERTRRVLVGLLVTVVLAIVISLIAIFASADSPQSASWMAYEGEADSSARQRLRRFGKFWKTALGPPKGSPLAPEPVKEGGAPVKDSTVQGGDLAVEQKQPKKREIKITKEDKKGETEKTLASKTEAVMIASTATSTVATKSTVATTAAGKSAAVAKQASTTTSSGSKQTSVPAGTASKAGTTKPTASPSRAEDLRKFKAYITKSEAKAKKQGATVNPKSPRFLRFSLRSKASCTVLRDTSKRVIVASVYLPNGKLADRMTVKEQPGTYWAVLKHLYKDAKGALVPADEALLAKTIKREHKWVMKKAGKKGMKKAKKGMKKAKKDMKKAKKDMKKAKKSRKAVKKAQKSAKKSAKKHTRRTKAQLAAQRKVQKEYVKRNQVERQAYVKKQQQKSLVQMIKEKRSQAAKKVRSIVVACKCAVAGRKSGPKKPAKIQKPAKKIPAQEYNKLKEIKVGDMTIKHGIKKDKTGRTLEAQAFSDPKGNKAYIAKGVDAQGRSVYIDRQVKVVEVGERKRLEARMKKLEKAVQEQKGKKGKKLSKAEYNKLKVELKQIKRSLKKSSSSSKSISSVRKSMFKKTTTSTTTTKVDRKVLKKQVKTIEKQLKDKKLSKQKRAELEKKLKVVKVQLKKGKKSTLHKKQKEKLEKRKAELKKQLKDKKLPKAKRDVLKKELKSIRKQLKSVKKTPKKLGKKQRKALKKRKADLKKQLKDKKLPKAKRDVLQKELKTIRKQLKSDKKTPKKLGKKQRKALKKRKADLKKQLKDKKLPKARRDVLKKELKSIRKQLKGGPITKSPAKKALKQKTLPLNCSTLNTTTRQPFSALEKRFRCMPEVKQGHLKTIKGKKYRCYKTTKQVAENKVNHPTDKKVEVVKPAKGKKSYRLCISV